MPHFSVQKSEIHTSKNNCASFTGGYFAQLTENQPVLAEIGGEKPVKNGEKSLQLAKNQPPATTPDFFCRFPPPDALLKPIASGLGPSFSLPHALTHSHTHILGLSPPLSAIAVLCEGRILCCVLAAPRTLHVGVANHPPHVPPNRKSAIANPKFLPPTPPKRRY